MLILFFIVFSSYAETKPEYNKKYLMKCESVDYNSKEYKYNKIVRCENKEAICYSNNGNGSGISCKFKEIKD